MSGQQRGTPGLSKLDRHRSNSSRHQRTAGGGQTSGQTSGNASRSRTRDQGHASQSRDRGMVFNTIQVDRLFRRFRSNMATNPDTSEDEEDATELDVEDTLEWKAHVWSLQNVDLVGLRQQIIDNAWFMWNFDCAKADIYVLVHAGREEHHVMATVGRRHDRANPNSKHKVQGEDAKDMPATLLMLLSHLALKIRRPDPEEEGEEVA